MSDYLLFFFGIVMLGLGAFMYLKPKESTKKEMRDSEEAVSKIKRNGKFVFICGVVVIIIGILILVYRPV